MKPIVWVSSLIPMRYVGSDARAFYFFAVHESEDSTGGNVAGFFFQFRVCSDMLSSTCGPTGIALKPCISCYGL